MKTFNKCYLITVILFVASISNMPAQVKFPGDANNDGTANYLDLLVIGINYGQSGAPHLPPDPLWLPHFFDPWDAFLPNTGINAGFQDANGDGNVDSTDVDIIVLNYDSLQSLSQPTPIPYQPGNPLVSTDTIRIHFDKDTVEVDEFFLADINFILPPESGGGIPVLGVALQLTYPEENVRDDMTEISFDTLPGDLMFIGALQNGISFFRSPDSGRVELGAAGKGFNALNSSQKLATLKFIVVDIIIRGPDVRVPFWIDASNLLVLNDVERPVVTTFISDTIILRQKINALPPVPDDISSVKVTPNPASSSILFQDMTAPVQIEILDIAGRVYHSSFEQPGDKMICIEQFPSGIYLARITGETGWIVKKIIKI